MPGTASPRRAASLDYTGRRHARITRSMKAVPRSVLPILTELRYLLKDGETQPISNAVLAARTGIGEGFVSAAVRWLAGEAIPYVSRLRTPPRHIFIERQPRQDGMPGFTITMLAPPELRSCIAVSQPALFLGDHAGDPQYHVEDTAAERAKGPQHGDHSHDPPILFMHAENESINSDPPPRDLDGGGAPIREVSLETVPPIAPGAAPAPDQGVATCDGNHQDLAPQVVSGHQALNPERPIPAGEWYELLSLQAAYGEARMLIWQARAARVARTGPPTIAPGYYHACAAQEACARHRPPRRSSDPRRLEPAPAPALLSPSPATPPPAPSALDPACDALLVEMGIRERHTLAGVSLAAIQQWAQVVDHPGLAARFDDVRAFAHAQLRRGNAPPSRSELERWATRVRARTASASPAPLGPADEERIAARESELQARASEIAPPGVTEDERLALLADLEAGLSDSEAHARLFARRGETSASDTAEPLCLLDLRLALPRRHWSLLERVTLERDANEVRLVCSVADRGLVEAYVLPAARAHDEAHPVRVVTRGAVSDQPLVDAPIRPDWIAAEQWNALPALMRTALAGSRRDADGVLHCASPALHALLESRYARAVAVLLGETLFHST